MLSKFLFDQTMDMPEAHEAALRTAPWLRSIRLNVFAIDEGHTVYDAEMQKDCNERIQARARLNLRSLPWAAETMKVKIQKTAVKTTSITGRYDYNQGWK